MAAKEKWLAGDVGARRPPGGAFGRPLSRAGRGRARDAGGRVRGQRGWVVEKAGEVIEQQHDDQSDLPALVEQFLTQFYGQEAALAVQSPNAEDGSSNAVPREVLVPVLPGNAEEVQQWLSALRGSNVQLRVPQRGDKKALAETVERNAKEALQQHKLKRAGDFTSRSAALPIWPTTKMMPRQKIVKPARMIRLAMYLPA